MSTFFPAVAAAYAAILGLLAAVLTVRVILNRVRTGFQAGDGGDARLGQAIRAHANFAEQAPLALLLLLFAEATGVTPALLNVLGVALVAARLASAWGLSRSLGATPQRQAGAGVTVLVITACAVLVLYRVLLAR